MSYLVDRLLYTYEYKISSHQKQITVDAVVDDGCCCCRRRCFLTKEVHDGFTFAAQLFYFILFYFFYRNEKKSDQSG